MISLRQINALLPAERDRCYLSLVPPSFCKRFLLDPLAFPDPQGRLVANLEAPLGEPWGRLSIKHRADALDPAFFLKLDESRYAGRADTPPARKCGRPASWAILMQP